MSLATCSLARYCVFLASLSLLVSGQNLWEQCFLPDGTRATNPQWQPCSQDPENSLSGICCALNRTVPSGGAGTNEFTTADVCLDNGVCMNSWTDQSGKSQSRYFRNYCTSEDWRSGKCLDVCRASNSGFSKITPCDGSRNSSIWCCGDNDDCCNQGLQEKQGLRPVTLAAKFQTTSATNSATSSASSTSGSSSESTPASSEGQTTSTPAASSDAGSSDSSQAGESQLESTDESGLSTGTKIGLGVGISGGAVAIIGLVFFLLMRRRRAKKAGTKLPELSSDGEITQHAYVQRPGEYLEANAQKDPSEMQGSEKHTWEMAAQEVRIELPDTQVETHSRLRDLNGR